VGIFEEMLYFSVGNDKGYFVAIFTRREIFKVQGHEVIPYLGTTMGRNLLIVHVSDLPDSFAVSSKTFDKF
jgi:hypothetical protein